MLDVKPPPERNGRLYLRAIWPLAKRPIAASGVPKHGEPDCMLMFERNEPKITGQPGRISWASAMPAKASAICCASVAGIETGDIAPIRRNGVNRTGWFASQ